MRIRTAVLVLFFVILIVLLVPFILFCLLFGQRDPLLSVGQWVVRVGRRILGVRVEVEGLGRIDRRAPVVYMANHESFLDGPIVMTVVPGVPRVILKKQVLRVPILGQAMRFVGFVPVDRKGAEGGKKSIARAAALMRERGYSYLIFPEGTRSLDGRLGPFRRGGFFLALESGAPIVPVTISGTFELMPKGQRFARKGRVRLTFHDPIRVSGYGQETMAALTDRVRTAIQSDEAASNSEEDRIYGQQAHRNGI